METAGLGVVKGLVKRTCALFLALFASPLLPRTEAASGKPLEFAFVGPFACDADHLTHPVNFSIPAGAYGKLVLDMDVTTARGPWNPINPRGWHNLFWMVRSTRNLYMFGYAALRKDGDKPPEAMLRQGMGVQHPKKTKDIKEVAIAPNTTYHINYLYDVAGGHAVLTLSQQGREVTRIESVPLLEPAAKEFTFGEGDTLTIGLSTAMGHNEAKAPETPSLGWTYRNLRVSLERAAD